MKNRKEKGKKLKIYASVIVLLCCTIIGGYGILKAPASDHDELERELRRNEQSLQQAVSSSSAEATSPERTDAPQTELPAATKQPERTISVIGDSVFLGAAPSFQKLQKNAVIDAKISRQVYHGIDVAKKLQKKNKLGDTVIISLGTNSKFNPVTGQELIDYLGPERTIYWINAYGKNLSFQDEVNKTIRDLVEKNDNVFLIPWADEGKKHPHWFYQDGTHLNTKGQEGFAKFVQEEIERDVTH